MDVSSHFFVYSVITAIFVAAAYHLLRQFLQNGAMYTKTNRIDGKVVIITGCNTGLGKAAAIELAKRGAKLYMACRDMKKCEAARQEIIKLSNNQSVVARELDLNSLASVRKFAQQFHKDETRLDILINNAGVCMLPKGKTADGFESHIGINHLGHFLLTHLLLDLLKASAPSRILNLSSISHKVGKINRNDLMSDRSFYTKFLLYANSKLACTLFTVQLDKVLTGTGVTVNSLDPGEVETEITRHLTWERYFAAPLMNLCYKSVDIGVQTHLMAALDPDLEKVSGRFLINCRIGKPDKKALDQDTAEWLWNESVKLTGLDK